MILILESPLILYKVYEHFSSNKKQMIQTYMTQLDWKTQMAGGNWLAWFTSVAEDLNPE